ncbi:hypothetical protein N752_30020 [Desulforamulus aquiferis]|nr:hypothetical protein [Desulforamulus aquiferis]RYD01540.1 hypothetical protein N752_30020 [Desulforamulus aquiferis]
MINSFGRDNNILRLGSCIIKSNEILNSSAKKGMDIVSKERDIITPRVIAIVA